MVKICTFDLENDKMAAVVAAISENPLETARSAKMLGADILEIRFDLLNITTPDDAKKLVNEIKSATNLPCIATNRLQSEGGKWSGTEEGRIGLLIDILELVDAVDIELSAGEDVRERVVQSAKSAGKTVIVSSHDFNRTPAVDQMRKTLDDCFDAGADIAKLAVMPKSMQDVLNLLQVTNDSKAPVCTISMGDLGKHSRIVASCYGSVLTYGSVRDAVAPGQLRVDELKTVLEMLL
ncbi:MAG: type I 3-dehydroquinate dehydratase [Methanosarcinaceae archaeon]|nr:type I 3-dehydroquinate dehydratase [Methanosarcinaceae archaeon]MDF1532903.1 type I 3-dehydroquinate dehydratase [Methanosarcinaceae archaeon]